MTHLRAKKQLEEMLQHRLGALENLHSTLIQVEQAAQNIDVRRIISFPFDLHNR